MIRKLRNALAVLVAAGVLLVGLPVGLWVGVGWPLPTAVPALDEIQLGFRSSPDPQLLIKSLAVIVWIVWAQLVVALAVEIVAVVRGRDSRRIPVMPGLQAAAGRLVAAVAVVAATAAPLKAPAAAALAPPVTVEAVAYPQPLEVAHRTDPAQVTAATERAARYTTQRFDTLWDIAEQALGDGRRWQEIRALNPQVTTPDGGVASGVDLTLPADAKPSPEETEPTQVTVAAGDSFWSIALDNLARAWGRSPNTAEITPYWREVIDANHDRLAPPHDPDLIYPGQVFDLPPPPDDPVAATPNPNRDGTVVVERGDRLWSIARQALTEAWDRPPTDAETARFLQDVIGRNRLADPDLIHPGDTFQLPPIPQTATAISASDSEPANPDQEQAEAERAAPRVSPPEQHSDIQPLPNPDVPISNGRSEPADSRSTPNNVGDTRPTVTDPPTWDPDASDQGSGFADAEGDDAAIDGGDDGDDTGLLPKAAAVAGMGIVAAGLVALINRLRRIQFQHRRPNTVPTPPPDTAAPVEVTLRSAATPTATELIDAALRAVGRHAVTANTPPPDIAGVHLSERDLRVLLWTPNPDPPEGWGTDDNNATWVLPADTDLTHLHCESDGVAAPYPTLVTAGQNPDGQLLVDLEFIGALQIGGTPDEVEAACYTIAAELAASTIADWLEVICVGFGHDLAQLERVQVVDHLDSALLDRLEEKANSVDEAQLTSLLAGRMSPGGDWWFPVIVIDPAATAPEGADRLLATAASGRAVAAVVGYPTSDSWCFDLEHGTVRVEPLGYELSRRDLTSREQQGLASLITAAKDLNGVPYDQTTLRAAANGRQPADNSPDFHAAANGKEPADDSPDFHAAANGEDTAGDSPDSRVAANGEDPAGDSPDSRVSSNGQDPAGDSPDSRVSSNGQDPADDYAEPSAEQTTLFVDNAGADSSNRVRVLGTVKVEGLSQRSRSRAELCTYLTLHRDGVEGDRLMEALWPNEPPDYERLTRTVSRTRKELGAGPDGDPYIPAVTGGIYRPGPHLHCDLTRFTDHTARADRTDGDGQLDHLQAALRLVSGTPFGGTKDGYTWVWAEGTYSFAVVAVDDAAHRLSQLALDNNDPDLATWSARQGLLSAPTCENCYRNLMRAAIFEDNQVALEVIYDELIAVVEADDDEPDAMSFFDPETVKLYEQHSRKRSNRRKR